MAESIATEQSARDRRGEATRETVLGAAIELFAAQGFEVEIGGELFSDAMGDPGGEGGSYKDMVRHNIDTIVGSLLQEK